MKKILIAIIMLATFMPAACWAADNPQAWVANHVMAGKIEYVQGQGFLVDGPTDIKFVSHSGANPSVSKFTTLDQIVFMSGTYKIDMKVLEDATGNVVATASHKSVTLSSNNSVESFVTDWSFTAKAGLYTYQLLVNDAVIASFIVDIDNAQ
jgi:hypothetical protein